MARTTIAAPDCETENKDTPPSTRHWQTEVCCGACDTLVTFEFTITADPDAPGGVFRVGPTWDRCPECGNTIAVPDCNDAGHVRAELLADGTSIVTCFVCTDRRRPVPVLQGSGR